MATTVRSLTSSFTHMQTIINLTQYTSNGRKDDYEAIMIVEMY